MDRTVSVGAASGSLSALLVRLASEAFRSESFPVCPDCPLCAEVLVLPESIDLPSLCLGLLVGLSIGPILDLLHLARHSWRVWLQGKLRELAKKNPEALYRLA